MKRKWKFIQSAGKIDRGFSLIEVLLALSVSTLTILLFSAILTQLVTVRNQTNDDRQIEWHLFLNQLEHDIEDNVLRDVANNRIRMWEVKEGVVQRDFIGYNLNSSKNVVRTRNGLGQQLMLMHIDSLSINRMGNKIELMVTFQNGESFSGRVKVQEAI